MGDLILNPYPTRHVDPDEPGLVAAYTFSDNELSVHGRYLNRARTGAAYDLATRVGTPLVGQGGGVYVAESQTSYFAATVPGSATQSRYTFDLELTSMPVALNVPMVVHGTVAGGRTFPAYSDLGTGLVLCSLNDFATWSGTAFPVTGRGRILYDVGYNGTHQQMWTNGILADSDAVVAVVPNGQFRIGNFGTMRAAKIKTGVNSGMDAASIRASYVREFAKNVTFNWTPRSVGESSTGIVTGQCLDELYCPSGHSSLKFVYDRENNQLGLQCDWSVSYYRLSTPRPRRPLFGSWLLRFKTRASASAGEGIVFGFVNNRTQEPTITPASYWGMIWSLGGIWTARLHRGNVPVVLLTTQLPSIPPNGTNIDVLITRDVAGNWRLGMRAGKNPWVYNDATVANDVTYLDFQYLVVDPQGSMFLSMTEYQSEMTPSEGNF